LTVSEAEFVAAEALSLENYKVRLVNKYIPGLHGTLGHEYTYNLIVDNNLASFACCLEHVNSMFENYRWCLDVAGWILTDRTGMDWTVDANAEWQLSPEELAEIARPFGFTTHRLGDQVYGLTGRGDATKRIGRDWATHLARSLPSTWQPPRRSNVATWPSISAEGQGTGPIGSAEMTSHPGC
jgi:hypothetical protein